VKIKIYTNTKTDSRKVADACVLLEDGDCAGILIRGFNIWRDSKVEGQFFVTPPNQKYQDKTGKNKYYHHLTSETDGAMKRLEDAILEAYEAKLSGRGEPPPEAADDGPF
jgi:hypothetical protein